MASSFNTALSVRQYLNAPDGAVYGFAPTPPRSIWRLPVRSPRTAVPGLYLASAYAGFGGYTGVVQSAGACANMILRESQRPAPSTLVRSPGNSATMAANPPRRHRSDKSGPHSGLTEQAGCF